MLIAAFAALGALAAPSALASHSQVTFFEAPRDLLNGSTRHKAFLQLQALGVKALRLELHWHDVAPAANSTRRPKFDAKNPASYSWGAYDAVLTEAQRLNWKVLLTVTSPVPKWATASKRDLITRPENRQFEEFMTAVGLHYGSMVSLWALWNEPNIAGWLMPQWNSNGTPASPRIYRGLWQAGYAGLKAAGIKSPQVLFGETSPFGQGHANIRREGTKREVAPLAFMREALCLNSRYRKASTCGRLPISGYAQHPYTYPAVQGPYYRPPERDEVTIGTLPRLSNALALAARAHAIPAHLPIYLTEFGVESRPNRLGVSLSEQAEYDAISEKIAWGDPQVLAFSQYLLTDEPAHGGLNGYRTGLETTGGGAQAALLRLPRSPRRLPHRLRLFTVGLRATGYGRHQTAGLRRAAWLAALPLAGERHDQVERLLDAALHHARLQLARELAQPDGRGVHRPPDSRELIARMASGVVLGWGDAGVARGRGHSTPARRRPAWRSDRVGVGARDQCPEDIRSAALRAPRPPGLRSSPSWKAPDRGVLGRARAAHPSDVCGAPAAV